KDLRNSIKKRKSSVCFRMKGVLLSEVYTRSLVGINVRLLDLFLGCGYPSA
ncbi:Hypothetical predicted protein, partial [Pelobates cultripes]